MAFMTRGAPAPASGARIGAGSESWAVLQAERLGRQIYRPDPVPIARDSTQPGHPSCPPPTRRTERFPTPNRSPSKAQGGAKDRRGEDDLISLDDYAAAVHAGGLAVIRDWPEAALATIVGWNTAAAA
jgi:hypothetical protein